MEKVATVLRPSQGRFAFTVDALTDDNEFGLYLDDLDEDDDEGVESYTETPPDQTRPDQTRPDHTRPDQTLVS